MLIILGGRPGSGKTSLARALAVRLGAVHLRIDSIEQALRRAGDTDIGAAGYAVGQALAADWRISAPPAMALPGRWQPTICASAEP